MTDDNKTDLQPSKNDVSLARFFTYSSVIMGVIGTALYIFGIGRVSDPSPHFYIAMFLGIFVTCLITLLLMGLVFYSGRYGFDGEFPNEDKGSQTGDRENNS